MAYYTLIPTPGFLYSRYFLSIEPSFTYTGINNEYLKMILEKIESLYEGNKEDNKI